MPVPPLVSVVLPVRDAEDTLIECLESIAAQREPRFECVIADDGSQDGTLALARDFAARDSRFRVLSGEPRGVAAAHNRAHAVCTTAFVARMDADDRMHPERLAAQLAAFAKDPGLDALGTHVRFFPREALGPGMAAYERWINAIDSPHRVREEAFVECAIANPTWMWRRERLPDLRYREDPTWPEDYDLLLSLLAAGHRIGVVPRVLHEWRQHPTRISLTSPQYSDEAFTACKARYLAEGFLARHERYTLWGYGRTGRMLAKALRAHGRQPDRIIELHPGRLGHRIQGAPVVAPAALGPPAGVPLLVSVAGLPAREAIRGELGRQGWRSGVDAVFAA